MRSGEGRPGRVQLLAQAREGARAVGTGCRFERDAEFVAYRGEVRVSPEVFLKFFQYGAVANLAHSRSYHREGIKRNGRRISKVKQMASMMRLWLTAKTYNDNRPSFKSFFPQMVKGV